MQFDFLQEYLLEDAWLSWSPLEENHLVQLELLSQDADMQTYFLASEGKGRTDFLFSILK